MKNEENNQKKSDDVSPIRTYTNDVADLVKNEGLSKTQIALAEQRRKIQDGTYYDDKQEKPKNKNWTKIILTILFIVLGAGILFFTFKYLLPENLTKSIREIVSGEDFLKKEASVKIYLETKTNNEVEEEIVKKIDSLKDSEIDKITEIEILVKETDAEGNTFDSRIVPRELMRIIDSNATDRFIRSLSDNFILGVYKTSEAIPFLILKTQEIDLSIAELYKWEKYMYADLEKILNLKSPEKITEIQIPIEVSTSTATSTEPAEDVSDEENATTTPNTKTVKDLVTLYDQRGFVDNIISNKDVRVILNEEGEIAFMYGFIDNENMVFVKNKKTFEEIIRRISNKDLIR